MHVLFSPIYLMLAIGVAVFGFMGWAGEDVNERSTRAILLLLTIPALVGWIIVGLRFWEIYSFEGWIGILLSLIYGLIALYAFFSLDRLEPAIIETFPRLDPKKRTWILYGFVAMNLPIILTIFNSLSSRYE